MIVATAVVVRGSTILVLKRSDAVKNFSSQWQLPEGKLEADETPGQALRREVNEELNCEVTAAELSSTNTTEGRVASGDIRVIRHVFRVEIAGDISLSSEHDQHHWLQSTELDTNKYDFTPGTLVIIKAVFRSVS